MFNDSKNEGSFLIDRLFGNDAEATRILLNGDFADVERYITEFSFGEVYMREGLNLEVREIITLTVLIAIGASKGQLRMHIKIRPIKERCCRSNYSNATECWFSQGFGCDWSG